MLKQVFLFLCLFSLLFQFSKAAPKVVVNGKFPSRQDEIVIAPKKIDSGDSFLIQSSNMGEFERTDIDDTQICDLNSFLMGLTPLNVQTERKAFPKSSLFNKAKVQAFIVIKALGRESLGIALPHLEKLGKKLNIVDNSFPHSQISRLTSIMTGATPSTHGITASQWDIHDATLNDPYVFRHPEITNFADIISKTFSGKSLVLAASGDYQLSAALCPHSSTLSQQPFWNNFCYFWDQHKEFMDSFSVQMQSECMFSKENLLKSLQNFHVDGFKSKYNSETKEITITNSQGIEATFSLAKQADSLLFVELQLVQVLQTQLSSKYLQTLVTDQTPDFLGVGFSSLSTLNSSCSEQPKQTHRFIIAVQLIDAVVSNFLKEINNVYHKQVTTSVVFLGSDKELDNQIQTAFQQTQQQNRPHSEQQFTALEQMLQDSQFQAYHLPQTQFLRSKRSNRYSFVYPNSTNGSNSSNSTNSTHTYTSDQIAMFQACLWIPIVLIVILIASVCAMNEVSASDTLLYRVSRPH